MNDVSFITKTMEIGSSANKTGIKIVFKSGHTEHLTFDLEKDTDQILSKYHEIQFSTNNVKKVK